MKTGRSFIARVWAISLAFSILVPVAALADGMPEEPRKRPAKPAYVPPKPEPIVAPPPAPEPIRQVEATEEECEWKFRLSPGVPVWFFGDEDTEAGAGLYADLWRTDIPLNYRVGVEGRHIDLHQSNAEASAEFPGKTVEATFIRIPFAIEYMQPIADDVTLFLGGGPDIIHTANDVSDTSVGGHLAGRIHYALDQNWGLALEAGYLWAEVEDENGDIDLSGAYVTPQAAYTF